MNTLNQNSDYTNDIMIDNPFNINYYNINEAFSVYRGLNHKLRQIILQTIASRGSVNVKNLYKELGLQQAVLSLHLAILRKTGILSVERQGKESHYSINYPRLAIINELSKNLIGQIFI